MKKLESYLEEAIKNVRDDRQVTGALLEDIIKYLAKNEEHHKYAGPVGFSLNSRADGCYRQ